MSTEHATTPTGSSPPRRPTGTREHGMRLGRNMRPPAPIRTNLTFKSDIVDQWGLQSFPASDPPANW